MNRSTEGGRERLSERVIAVIGCGSGIGESVARRCADEGAVVACLDRNDPEAERVARNIEAEGGRAAAGVVDITDATMVREVIESIAARHGRLDGVVCTPGLNIRKPILAYEQGEFERVVDVNLRGSFNVLQSAARVMRAAGGGSIVLFASIRAQVVEPGQGVYAATKAGVVQLARAAAAELGAYGLRVNTVAPGVVETPLTQPIRTNAAWYEAYASRSALGRWGRPAEIAGPTVFLLSDDASYMTGAVLFVDGGWTAIDGRFDPPGMAID